MRLTEAERIFHDALGVASGAERSAFLEVECGADGELRLTVERLLTALEEAPGFLNSPTRKEQGSILVERPGTPIGPYRLLQRLGEGGLGWFTWPSKRSRSSGGWR